MYCIKCGAENSDTAVYCRKCGVAIEETETVPEEETRVAVRPDAQIDNRSRTSESDEGEKEIFTISPTLKFVKAGYVGAAVAALLFVGLTSSFLSNYISVWEAVFLGLLLFLIPAYYHFLAKLVRYTLTDSKLEIDSGLISRTTRNVPLRRIQDVTVSATPWQRLFGFGDMVIDNASDDGGKTVLKNIDSPKHYADELLTQMRRLEK